MEHRYQKFWEKDSYRVIDCQSCGFYHILPVPDQNTLTDYYQMVYHREVKPFPYHNVTSNYIDEMKNEVSKNKNYQEIYQKVIRFKETPGFKMLDIGCGNELLGVYFKNNNWQVNIVEPSKDAGLYLEKFELNVFNLPVEELENTKIDGVSFVNMQFVLEHILNPRDVLKEIFARMSQGGIIRINVPNDFSHGQLAYLEKYRRNPDWVYLPDHINYFNFDSLSRLLSEVGFREIYRTTNFPLEFLLAGGIDYYASETERQKVGPFINHFEATFTQTGRAEILQQLYENLAQQGMGRSIFMYAIKE